MSLSNSGRLTAQFSRVARSAAIGFVVGLLTLALLPVVSTAPDRADAVLAGALRDTRPRIDPRLLKKLAHTEPGTKVEVVVSVVSRADLSGLPAGHHARVK